MSNLLVYDTVMEGGWASSQCLLIDVLDYFVRSQIRQPTLRCAGEYSINKAFEICILPKVEQNSVASQTGANILSCIEYSSSDILGSCIIPLLKFFV
mmetsp:Transcript_636/g.900  ORF Transcript_636/g.900 Transcript_636/m.900 type:complete len:97 (+) Transcript_636:334-624(+)